MEIQNATLPGSHSVLPDPWVVRLFGQMELMFGSKFSNLWRNVDPVKMRAHWAEKLGGFADKPDAIRQAIAACEEMEDPPNLAQFLKLCRDSARRCADKVNALEHKLTPEEREAGAKIAHKANEVIKSSPGYDYKGWAKRLRIEYMAGVRLNNSQISAASVALDETWEGGICVPKLKDAA